METIVSVHHTNHFPAHPDSPIEIVIGSWFLYDLLGPSCFVGLAATLAFLPMNHFAGKIVVSAQDNLMRARDERVALMNEVLGAIRMLKVSVTVLTPDGHDSQLPTLGFPLWMSIAR